MDGLPEFFFADGAHTQQDHTIRKWCWRGLWLEEEVGDRAAGVQVQPNEAVEQRERRHQPGCKSSALTQHRLWFGGRRSARERRARGRVEAHERHQRLWHTPSSYDSVPLGLVAAAHGDVSGAVAALSAAYKTDPKATQILLERAAAAIAPAG